MDRARCLSGEWSASADNITAIIWGLWLSLFAVQANLQNCFVVFFYNFFSHLRVSNTSHRCKVRISSSTNGSQDVCLFCACLCICKHVPPCSPSVCVCVCMCVLVGRLSIPSVTIAVPSFHASAAPRESSSLGSLSVLFNEHAPHQNAG